MGRMLQLKLTYVDTTEFVFWVVMAGTWFSPWFFFATQHIYLFAHTHTCFHAVHFSDGNQMLSLQKPTVNIVVYCSGPYTYMLVMDFVFMHTAVQPDCFSTPQR